MDGDVSFDFDQGRCLDQGLGLGVNGVARIGIGYRSDRFDLLLFLPIFLAVVEFDVALEEGRF